MIDLRVGELRHLYMANATRPVVVDIPALSVLAIDGMGDPATSPAYQDAVASLTALAWGIRAIVKAEDPAAVFKVMPLEGVWTLPDELTFSEDPAIRGQLRWTLQIVLPAEIDLPVIERSRAETTRRKPHLCSLDRVERRSLPEDHAAQMLHRGPYRNEPVTLDLIHRFIRERGSRPKPGHREIYLNDPRRTEAAKLRTILRVASTRP
jgi:hypothetical protein